MLKFLLLLAIYQTVVVAQISSSCQSYLDGLIIQPSNQTTNDLWSTIKYSGVKLSDFGDMKGCNQEKGMKYSVLKGGPLNSYIGFCFSDLCTPADYNQNQKEFMKALTIFAGLYNITIPTALYYYQFTMVNPEDYNPPKSAFWYGTLAITIVLGVLAFVDPALKFFVNNQSLNFKFLKSFNIIENGQKILTLRNDDKSVAVLNCIRIFSFLQVVYGHDFMLHFFINSNPINAMGVINEPYVLIIWACLYSVDVFFFLSGFFLSFTAVDEQQLKLLSFDKPQNYLLGLLHRLFRLWPCYIYIVFFYWTLSTDLRVAPSWDLYLNGVQNCDTRWWRAILFIDIFGDANGCLGWGWYLQCEWWIFCGALLLMMVYSLNKMIGQLSILAAFIVAQSYVYYVYYEYNFKVMANPAALFFDRNFFPVYYSQPLPRSAPYFIGMLLGVFYKEWRIAQDNKGKQVLDQYGEKTFVLDYVQRFCMGVGKWIFMLIGLGIMAILMFAVRPVQENPQAWSNWWQSFFAGSSHSAYVIGITFFILPSLLGSQDIIARVMSSDVFAWFTRISFTGYLTHLILIGFSIYGSKDTVYLGWEEVNYAYIGDLFFTFVTAILLSLFVQLPFMNLEKWAFETKKNNPGKKPLLNQNATGDQA